MEVADLGMVVMAEALEEEAAVVMVVVAAATAEVMEAGMGVVLEVA